MNIVGAIFRLAEAIGANDALHTTIARAADKYRELRGAADSLHREVERLREENQDLVASLRRTEASLILLGDTVQSAIKGSEIDLRVLRATCELRSFVMASEQIATARHALQQIANTKNWQLIPVRSNQNAAATISAWDYSHNERDPWFWARIVLKDLFGEEVGSGT